MDNWLRLPFIERGGANAIRVTVSFTMSACAETQVAQLCKETFDLYYVEADSDDASFTWESPPYQKVTRIAADDRFEDPEQDASLVVNVGEEHFGPLTKKGFYVAFVDTGACMSITRVRIYSVVCPETIVNYAIFNRTFEGGTQWDLTNVQGTCVDNAEPLNSDDVLIYYCQFGGGWQALTGSCGCSPGYQSSKTKDSCEGKRSLLSSLSPYIIINVCNQPYSTETWLDVIMKSDTHIRAISRKAILGSTELWHT